MPYGINAAGDVLARTVDGKDLNYIWRDMQDALKLYNDKRTAVVRALCYNHTEVADYVVQSPLSDVAFEQASEYGVPKSVRTAPQPLTLGYMFGWFDTAARYTFQFLAKATAEQVQSVHSAVIEADNRLVFNGVMGALLNNATRLNDTGQTVYPLYAGLAGDKPMPYLNTTFADAHQHYLTSGSATLDALDVETVVRKVTEHGYGQQPGQHLLVWANPAEADVVRSFRAGQGTPAAKWDFIPSEAAPPYLTAETIVGDLAPASYEGLSVIGSYGPVWVIEEPLMPAGYVLTTVAAGSGSPLNPVVLREHVRSELRGLKHLHGPSTAYPIQDSNYVRGFGTGVRHRGAAAVIQVTTNASYTAPAAFVGAP